ncbi:hypothetical protein VAB18032_16520 [Micromonospora maris AB-18-032]|uniref:Uncharacterized protein n=1 Tax=Micromonospora maris TaxID=1003110 RepID=A0A9X0HZC5_9ACTN|nr:hypothetical protein VAB18032_16520 [Micromonospora maris AB-18-032]KUJ43933.1 hypothetical protein ADL17_11810 [Micromonospora maris]
MVLGQRLQVPLHSVAAQELDPGGFDVLDRPGPEFAYDRAAGWRVDPDGHPVYVHPYLRSDGGTAPFDGGPVTDE